MSKKRDNQRNAVYKWEGTISWGMAGLGICPKKSKTGLPLEGCEALVHRVWADLMPIGARVPYLKDGRGRLSACGGRHYISLPRWFRYPIIVLHETAHAILDWHENKCSVCFAWHGPEFASLFLELLELYASVDAKSARALGESQKPRRVRFDDDWRTKLIRN